MQSIIIQITPPHTSFCTRKLRNSDTFEVIFYERNCISKLKITDPKKARSITKALLLSQRSIQNINTSAVVNQNKQKQQQKSSFNLGNMMMLEAGNDDSDDFMNKQQQIQFNFNDIDFDDQEQQGEEDKNIQEDYGQFQLSEEQFQLLKKVHQNQLEIDKKMDQIQEKLQNKAKLNIQEQLSKIQSNQININTEHFQKTCKKKTLTLMSQKNYLDQINHQIRQKISQEFNERVIPLIKDQANRPTQLLSNFSDNCELFNNDDDQQMNQFQLKNDYIQKSLKLMHRFEAQLGRELKKQISYLKQK